jgi:hypothetical protein
VAPRRFVALLVALAACGCGSSGGAKTENGGTGRLELGPSFDSIATLPGAQRTPPPWDNGAAKLQERLKAIGLSPLPVEGTVVHIHQHLDLYVSGRRVTVPANIGIDPGHFFSPLHTHDTSGIIHVESATQSAFSLGQFFAVWGVPLSARRIGTLATSGTARLRAWVNGKPLAADPTRIVLAPHQEIVIAYGTAAQMPKKIPSSYTFPEGL